MVAMEQQTQSTINTIWEIGTRNNSIALFQQCFVSRKREVLNREWFVKYFQNN